MDIRGGYAKPNWKDILWVQLFLLPVTMVRWVPPNPTERIFSEFSSSFYLLPWSGGLHQTQLEGYSLGSALPSTCFYGQVGKPNPTGRIFSEFSSSFYRLPWSGGYTPNPTGRIFSEFSSSFYLLPWSGGYRIHQTQQEGYSLGSALPSTCYHGQVGYTHSWAQLTNNVASANR